MFKKALKWGAAALTTLLLASGGFAFQQGYLQVFFGRSPFLPSLGDPASRKAVFSSELAKHPEAQCSEFKELYVETGVTPEGQKSVWHVQCGSGLIVGFVFGPDGKLVKVAPEGYI